MGSRDRGRRADARRHAATPRSAPTSSCRPTSRSGPASRRARRSKSRWRSPSPIERASRCRSVRSRSLPKRAEHVALGVPCGIQDQLTSLTGTRGCAVRIDCRTLDVEPIPIPASLAVVVIHSGVARTLEGSPWQQRRADSFAVAAALGLAVLRDATRGTGCRHRRAVAMSSARSRASSSSRTRCARVTSTRSGR